MRPGIESVHNFCGTLLLFCLISILSPAPTYFALESFGSELQIAVVEI